MKRREIEQEIQAAYDGEPVDEAALRERLLGDPAALDAWCDHALLDAELRRHARGRLKVPGTVPASEVVRRAARQRRAVIVSWASAAAVVILCAVFLGRMWISRETHSGRLVIAPGSIMNGLTSTEMIRVEQGQPIHLAQGVAEITLPSGVHAVIDGPAHFQLDGMNGLRLDGGHSWFRVPAGAEGFTVITPRFDVVDLGTEFGIDLREDNPLSVHVLDGKVEARSKTGRQEIRALSAGEAVRLSPTGSWERLPAASKDFRRSLPQRLPEFHLDFDGPELTAAGDAIGVADAAPRLSGTGARRVPGVRGMALEFDGRGAQIETSWPGIPGSAPRTVTLWCRLPAGWTPSTAPPFVLWGNPVLGWNRKFKVAPVAAPGGGAVLRASFGEYYVSGSIPIADGGWHHLAVVHRGLDAAGLPILEFYVDGVPDSLKPTGEPSGVSTDVVRGIGAGLSIGRYELRSSGSGLHLVGAIDELRVHAGALDAGVIREMAASP